MTIILVLIAVAVLFVVATRLSRAGQMTGPLRALRGAEADVRVWGSPLPGSTPSSHRIDSVRSFGVGLLIWLQVPGGEIILLKIAQPDGLVRQGQRIEIAQARYVQWAGARLKRAHGVPALVLNVRETTASPPR